MAGVKTIIGLAFTLASGLLLVILSCALYSNWWPLFVVLTYICAPLPNILVKRISGDDFIYNSNSNNGAVEAGYFVTAILIVSGFGLPLVLLHAKVIGVEAMALSVSGGVLVYTAILAYIHFFAQESDDIF